MNVLIVGGGGREHALAWKAAQSNKVTRVFVAPGNAGTQQETNVENVNIQVDDIEGLLTFAQSNQIELVIIGPELPLVMGITDRFQAAGVPCFGPGRQAAQLEGSKSFTKDFLARHQIPTAAYQTFTDYQQAKDYLLQSEFPIVIKADGLAAGKGVIIAQNFTEADQAIQNMMQHENFGEAGKQVVIEAFLMGEEASFIVMADGKNILPLATSQDHKARDNGDKGPNTGGMGAYSPAPVVTAEIYQKIMSQVIEPTIKGLAADGMPYTGFLYAGIMIADDGTPNVLEYNCRFGDPETQPIMMRLNSDIVELCQAALDKNLDNVVAKWHDQPALGVVLAAGGYPKSYQKGDRINGLDQINSDQIKIFHAGTRYEDSNVVTHGGRVLCVCALGNDIADAQKKAYHAVDKISWNHIYYRTDIGFKAIS